LTHSPLLIKIRYSFRQIEVNPSGFLPPVRINRKHKKVIRSMVHEKKETEATTSAELLSQAVQIVGNHYLMCNLLSQRIKQLSDGAPKRVPSQGLTITETAVREIVGGHLRWDFSGEPQ
jgi:hypothetical protein